MRDQKEKIVNSTLVMMVFVVSAFIAANITYNNLIEMGDVCKEYFVNEMESEYNACVDEYLNP